MFNKKYLIYGSLGVLGLTFIILPSINFKNKNTYDKFIKQASIKYGVPFYLLKALIAAESSFNQYATAGYTSAIGLTQMTKAAAKDVGVDWNFLYDPETSINAGAAYLRLLYNKLGLNNWYNAVRAYYQGLGNEIKYKSTDLKQINLDADKYLEKIRNYRLAFLLKDPVSYIMS